MSWALKSARKGPGGVAISLGLICLPWLVLLNGCAATGPHSTPDNVQPWSELVAGRQADPTEPYWVFRMAEQSRSAGATGLARAQLDTALSLAPDYGPAAALLSKIQFEAGEYEAAVSLLQGILDRDATAPDELRVALALNLQALAQPEAAAVALAACKRQSGSVLTAQVAGLLQGEDFQSSLPQVEAAVAADPQSAANHNNLGVGLLYAGEAAAARDEFKQALVLNPQLPGALYNLAIVENFYFFDRPASQEYFQRYRTAAHQQPAPDPDDLGSLLAEPKSGLGRQALLSASALEASHD